MQVVNWCSLCWRTGYVLCSLTCCQMKQPAEQQRSHIKHSSCWSTSIAENQLVLCQMRLKASTITQTVCSHLGWQFAWECHNAALSDVAYPIASDELQESKPKAVVLGFSGDATASQPVLLGLRSSLCKGRLELEPGPNPAAV